MERGMEGNDDGMASRTDHAYVDDGRPLCRLTRLARPSPPLALARPVASASASASAASASFHGVHESEGDVEKDGVGEEHGLLGHLSIAQDACE